MIGRKRINKKNQQKICQIWISADIIIDGSIPGALVGVAKREKQSHLPATKNVKSVPALQVGMQDQIWFVSFWTENVKRLSKKLRKKMWEIMKNLGKSEIGKNM